MAVKAWAQGAGIGEGEVGGEKSLKEQTYQLKISDSTDHCFPVCPPVPQPAPSMQQRDAPRENFFLFALHAQELPDLYQMRLTRTTKGFPHW